MWRGITLATLLAACGSASVQRSVQVGAAVEEQATVVKPGTVVPPDEEPVDSLLPTNPTGMGPTTDPGKKPEYLAAGLLEGDVALDEGWARWKAGTAKTFDEIFEIAVLANRARPIDTSDELMVIALADAVEASGCDPDRLGKIRLMAIMVRGAEHPKHLTAELDRLSDVGPIECEKLR